MANTVFVIINATATVCSSLLFIGSYICDTLQSVSVPLYSNIPYPSIEEQPPYVVVATAWKIYRVYIWCFLPVPAPGTYYTIMCTSVYCNTIVWGEYLSNLVSSPFPTTLISTIGLFPAKGSTEVLINFKTSEWLRIIVANTLPLATNLANQIGTDVEVLTDVSTTIQGSSSVIKDCKIRQGN